MLDLTITEGQTMLLLAGIALAYIVALTFVLALCRMAKFSGEVVLEEDPTNRGQGVPMVPLNVRVLPLRFDDEGDDTGGNDSEGLAGRPVASGE